MAGDNSSQSSSKLIGLFFVSSTSFNCSSVSFCPLSIMNVLVIIKLLFCISCKPGRNESNCFLSFCKYYKQHISDFSYRNISIFISTMFKIKHFNIIRIIKNICCRFKRNFMFFLVSNILIFVLILSILEHAFCAYRYTLAVFPFQFTAQSKSAQCLLLSPNSGYIIFLLHYSNARERPDS